MAKGHGNGHLLRRCHQLRGTVPTPEPEHLTALRDLLKEAIALAGRRAEVQAEDFARSVQGIEDRLDQGLEAYEGETRVFAKTWDVTIPRDLT